MKKSMIWLPNAISISRIFVSPLIVLMAIVGDWPLAFVLLAIGLITDWLDGFVAIKLNACSNTGKRLEPICDLLLVSGALAGLLLTDNLSWVLAVVLILVGAVIIIISRTFSDGSKLKIFCTGFIAFYYLGLITSVTGVYAVKAFSQNALWLIVAAIPIGLISIKTKQHRLRAWLNGQS